MATTTKQQQPMYMFHTALPLPHHNHYPTHHHYLNPTGLPLPPPPPQINTGGHAEQGGQVPPEERQMRLQALRCLINTLVSLVQWYARSNPDAMTEYGQTGVEEHGVAGGGRHTTPGGVSLTARGRSMSEEPMNVGSSIKVCVWRGLWV